MLCASVLFFVIRYIRTCVFVLHYRFWQAIKPSGWELLAMCIVHICIRLTRFFSPINFHFFSLSSVLCVQLIEKRQRVKMTDNFILNGTSHPTKKRDFIFMIHLTLRDKHMTKAKWPVGSSNRKCSDSHFACIHADICRLSAFMVLLFQTIAVATYTQTYTYNRIKSIEYQYFISNANKSGDIGFWFLKPNKPFR